MAGFSVAANAFSVVGLADVVFRLGVDTAGLYSRYRNASSDIDSLVDEIQAFVASLAQIRVYLDEYHQSTYAQGDGQTLPPQFSQTLSDCEKELRDLQHLANKNKNELHDGLAVQMMKSWRWASQHEHVSKCRKRIRHHNINLQTILVLIGRKDEIVLHKELRSTRTDINTAGLTVKQTLHSMEDSLTSKHEKANALVRNQSVLISQLMKQSEDHHLELLQRIPNLTLEQTEEDDFIFQGDNLDAIVLPLLLIKSDLFKTIQTLQKEGVLHVSRSEAQWILQHFDNLLARGHAAAANHLNGRLRNDRTKAIPGSFDLKPRERSSKQWQEHMAVNTKVSAFDQIGRITHTSTICTPSGVLVLQTGSSNRPVQHHQNLAISQVFRLSFYPKPEVSLVNISMLMTTKFGRNMELEIPRLIQIYNTIPTRSETWNVIMDDDVRGLQNIFKDGRGSPNDIFDFGWSLCATAAHFQRTATCEYLIREGACTSLFSPFGSQSTSLLQLIWLNLLGQVPGSPYFTVKAIIEKALHLSNLAIKHGCDPNMVSAPRQANMIHSFIMSYCNTSESNEKAKNKFTGLYNRTQLSINEFREIFSLMVGMGCELEGRENLGHTALHMACYFSQLNMIMALIEIGADTNVTSNDGSGVLHCLLAADECRQDNEDDLYRGLVILLTNKSDPNHLNDDGMSPSDFIWIPRRKNTWAKAVIHTGYKILVIKSFIDCGHEEKIMVIASPEFEFSDDDSKLPVSKMTLDEWSGTRRERLGCQECRANEDAAGSCENSETS